MNTSLRAPAASASSAAYWISGLSTIGSISFGLALVAGRKRVPRPATGKTAVLISCAWATAHLRRNSQERDDTRKEVAPWRDGRSFATSRLTGALAGLTAFCVPRLVAVSTLMLARLRSSTLAPMPLILRRSSALLNAPFFSLYATIACALLRPMPCNSLAMVAASAVLMSTGPAQTSAGMSVTMSA